MGPGIVIASSNGYFPTVAEAEDQVTNNGNEQLNDDFVPSSLFTNQYSAGRNVKYVMAS
jgi:hypothetical protein